MLKGSRLLTKETVSVGTHAFCYELSNACRQFLLNFWGRHLSAETGFVKVDSKNFFN
ncbi:hypothetical protein LEP1GSC062_2694 [Leptospira alexanderi serovar Manhao 3 str. L 60]|uniref:Uncharacterized protein n=1 Tax=Leptospira alexanderi serovar Manhao 3 str. L 60 TaxID=1049759 RepID=V6I6C8_9LEPT|nr:hypothetical protein LEP1GSC062_2694 [Leptospira alexanderi serovar Manhao 3 str. L 60]